MRPLDPRLAAEARRLQRDGIAATNEGRPQEGAALLIEGLALLGWTTDRPRPDHPEAAPIVARLVISFAYTEAVLGRAPEGLALLDAATRWTAPEDEGHRLQQRAAVLRMCGRKSEALDDFFHAEPLVRAHGTTLDLWRLLLNRGTLFSVNSQFTEALRDVEKSLLIARQNDWPVEEAKALHTRGIIERNLGDVPSALRSFEAARDLYERHAPGLVAVLLAATGTVLQDVGLLREAILLLDDAIADMRDTGQIHALARALSHRAELALATGEPEVAAALGERARQLAETQGDLGISCSAELVLRQAEHTLGRAGTEFAGECLALAARMREFGADGNAELAALLAARSLIESGGVADALDVLARFPRTRSVESMPVRLARRLTGAELARAKNAPAAALGQLRTGLRALQHYRSRLGSVEFQTGLSLAGRDLAELGVSLSLDGSRPSSVFTWSERARAQAYRLPSVNPPEDPEVSTLLRRLREARKDIREAEVDGEPTVALVADCQRLERELRERSWRADGPGESVPEVRPAAVHDALTARDAAMVSFLRSDGTLHALTLVRGRTRVHDLGPAALVDEGVRRLVADLDALMGRAIPRRMADAVRASIRHQTTTLADTLFAPLLPLLGERDLVVVPTQSLSLLPWGLLPPLRGRPLTVAPSASVWIAAGTDGEVAQGTPVLAAGPELPQAEAELTAIARNYPTGTALLGEQATAAAVLALLDDAPMAHLAAHGHHEPDNVLFSRLDLADGPLMAYDIARLAKPPRHVTLSACDVGRSVVAAGDETLGFTAALLYAGTSTVVSSVARVPDDVAAEVMIDYHARLAAGTAPARALAESNARGDLAPFVLFGTG